jgi:ABC-type branched-subunit amino acid transport system substrate-binding protein
MRAAAVFALAVLVAACSQGSARPLTSATAVVVVDAPFTKLPSVAGPILRGTTLAAEEINASGGVMIGAARVRLVVHRMDNALSPTVSERDVQRAIADHAVAIVTDGTGVDASWSAANAAGVPIGIVYQGGTGLVDAATRHNVFRIAPTDHGAAFRLAEYLVPKGLELALLHDDTGYGQDGAVALRRAFARNPEAVAADLQIPADGDPGPQLLAARQRGATALLVWAGAPAVSQVLRSARAGGWSVSVYTGTSGSDPLVRQQVADHPEWIDGLGFVSSRLTAERGPQPFARFRAAYERRFGADDVGVRENGKPVVQAPEWAMYAYDYVHVLAAAMTKAGLARPGRALLDALESVDVPGANGDDRGFNQKSHEGVVDDDIFFARFHGFVWAPVKDDPLSATLPSIPQTR